MEIFKLFGSIFVDTTEADEKIQKTDNKGKKIAETLGNGIKTAAKWGAAIVGAAAAAGAAMVGAATKTAANCDEIDKMSQKLGISREAYQEWNYILSQNGADINSLGAGMKTLTANMDKVTEGNKTAIANFNKLGVSVYDSTGKLKSQEQMFEETVKALQGMEDGTEKARLATEMFGKQGQELMPLLNGEAGSVEELKNKAHDLGMVLGDETVDAGVSFTDTMDTLKRAGKGLFTVIGGTVMPIVEKVANVIIDNMPVIQEMIGQFTPLLGQAAETILPPLMQLAEQLLPIIFDLLRTIITGFRTSYTSYITCYSRLNKNVVTTNNANSTSCSSYFCSIITSYSAFTISTYTTITTNYRFIYGIIITIARPYQYNITTNYTAIYHDH